jgi:hypothetical protein
MTSTRASVCAITLRSVESSTPSGPFTLSLTLRAPEYAIVLPYGDTDALLDACRNLSDLWNGCGALLIPVDEDGGPISRLVPDERILAPDRVIVHPAVKEPASEVALKRWPRQAVRWGEWIFRNQVHSWWVIRDAQAHDVPLLMPAPRTPAEDLLAAVLWGYIDPANMDELRKQFLPSDIPADALPIALVEAQLTRRSPLSWGAKYMTPTLTLNGPHWRTMYVLPDEPDFDDLICFWNLRARYPSMPDTPLFVGMPHNALSEQARAHAAIHDWLSRPPGSQKPAIFVDPHENDADRVHAGLRAVGLTHVESSAWKVGDIPEDRRDPEYTLLRTELPQRLERGLSADVLTSLHEGVNKVRLPIPTEFPTRLTWVGHVTAVIDGLPLWFPMTDILAQDWLTPAVAQGSGLRVATAYLREHYEVDLNWPAAQTQLSKHMATANLRAEISQAGQLADTLFGRIATHSDLDALALPHALDVLESLVARRSKKIAQHVRKELQKSQLAEINEDVVADVLRREGLFAELEVNTLIGMQGSVGATVEAILPTLAALCEAGYVQRGRSMHCPLCHTLDFWRLAELDDRIRCRACLQEFPLPAIEDDHEPPTAYRLDAFVARAMGQDIIPVVLTLRHLINKSAARGEGRWWGGLDLYEGDADKSTQEIDLLYAEAGTINLCEVKRTAGGLTVAQAENLCALASRLNAQPVFSAPAGEWDPNVVELAEKEGALLFDASLLVTKVDPLSMAIRRRTPRHRMSRATLTIQQIRRISTMPRKCRAPRQCAPRCGC